MPLSLSKLEKLLSLKGFVPNKYFIMHGSCVYIEIVSISNADIFLLYIPSKYTFRVKSPNGVYKIKYMDIKNDRDNTADDYAGDPDEDDLENKYEEIEVNVSPMIKDKNIESHLEERYNRKISLKDVSREDTKELKNILRQLRRFRFCVQTVKYKIAIIYKNYLCSIKRDNELECYSIKRYPSQNTRKLYVTVDLELFYNKMDSLMLNMRTIRKGLYHILDKNQFNHTRTLKRLLEEKSDIIKFSDRAYRKKQEYEKYLKDLQTMLESVNESEKKLVTQLYEAEERHGAPGLQNDINKTHQTDSINAEIEKISQVKQDIVKNIFKIQNKKENTILFIDKIMFDNTVMLECILRNFADLGKICY